MDAYCYVLRIRTDRAFADVLQAALETLGGRPAAWHDEDTDTAVVEEYFDEAAAAETRRGDLDILLAGAVPDGLWKIEIARMAARDWKEAWKEFFHAARVSRRLVVKPSWETFEAQQRDCVIDIDPGMSFGTGTHPTTRACLRFLDDLCADSPGGTFADLGCGSGILSIAAIKLGMQSALAVDNDPDSYAATQANCLINRVDGVTCRLGDLAGLGDSGRYDVVCANILAPVLIQYAPAITGLVSTGRSGRLILSGVLNGEYDRVRGVYVSAGFTQLRTIQDGDWTSGCYCRAPWGQTLPRTAPGG